MIKKELPYFYINGNFGGNQSWFLDPWMHIGGCGALTMCDLMIYMALYRNRPECYPFQLDNLTKKDYRKFGMQMKPFLPPRESGIKDIADFIKESYIFFEMSELEGIELKTLDGNRPAAEAKAAIKDSIDCGMPVIMLMLNHQNKKYEFFEWHWFLIVGYSEADDSVDRDIPDTGSDTFQIKVATYGKAHWLDFNEFWDTGCEERGGLVLVND